MTREGSGRNDGVLRMARLLSLYDPLTLQIGYRWILWRVFSAATGGQTFHFVVRIGIEEKRDRISGFIAGIIVGKVLDANEKII